MDEDRQMRRISGYLQETHHVFFFRVPGMKMDPFVGQGRAFNQIFVIVQTPQTQHGFDSHGLELNHSCMCRLSAAEQVR